MKEREARGAFSFFRPSPDGRISRVKTAPPAAQDDRSRMNVRPWFGSAVLACATHSFLGGGDKHGLIAGRRRPDYPGSFADTQMDGRTASGAKRILGKRLMSKNRQRTCQRSASGQRNGNKGLC